MFDRKKFDYIATLTDPNGEIQKYKLSNYWSPDYFPSKEALFAEVGLAARCQAYWESGKKQYTLVGVVAA